MNEHKMNPCNCSLENNPPFVSSSITYISIFYFRKLEKHDFFRMCLNVFFMMIEDIVIQTCYHLAFQLVRIGTFSSIQGNFPLSPYKIFAQLVIVAWHGIFI